MGGPRPSAGPWGVRHRGLLGRRCPVRGLLVEGGWLGGVDWGGALWRALGLAPVLVAGPLRLRRGMRAHLGIRSAFTVVCVSCGAFAARGSYLYRRKESEVCPGEVPALPRHAVEAIMGGHFTEVDARAEARLRRLGLGGRPRAPD